MKGGVDAVRAGRGQGGKPFDGYDKRLGDWGPLSTRMFMVPFDGSPLAEAALAKAKLYAIALDDTDCSRLVPVLAGNGGWRSPATSESNQYESPPEITTLLFRGHSAGGVEVVAVSVVPESRSYAEKKGWVEEDEVFSRRTVVERLHRRAAAIAPNADFRAERIDSVATGGTIAAHLRRTAEDLDASEVIVGGQRHEDSAASLGSVTRGMVAGGDYTVGRTY